MKNKYIFNLLGALALGFASQAQLLNSGFESWTAGNPDNWLTTNSVGVGLVTISETADHHGGSKAVHGEVISFFGTTVPPFLQAGEEGVGFAVSQNPSELNLFYKFNPVSGDRFMVNIACYKNGTAIGAGDLALGAAVSNYTALTVPITYFAPETADTIIIQFSIFGPNTGSDYHVGSEMFIDDLSFTGGPASVNELLSTERKAYPNPASDKLHIPVEGLEQGELTVYDLSGKKVSSFAVIAGISHYTLDVASLPSGIYTYSLSDGKSVYREKFVVNRE